MGLDPMLLKTTPFLLENLMVIKVPGDLVGLCPSAPWLTWARGGFEERQRPQRKRGAVTP